MSLLLLVKYREKLGDICKVGRKGGIFMGE